MSIVQIENSARQRDIEAEEKYEAEERERRRKNREFTQVYKPGWQRIDQLAFESPGALRLYTYFAQEIDENAGIIVADQAFLAKQLGVTDRTIRNYVSTLEKLDAIIKVQVAGRVYAYALDPAEVWRGYNTAKKYASFNTKTLVDKDGEIKKRLKLMMLKRQEEDV